MLPAKIRNYERKDSAWQQHIFPYFQMDVVDWDYCSNVGKLDIWLICGSAIICDVRLPEKRIPLCSDSIFILTTFEEYKTGIIVFAHRTVFRCLIQLRCFVFLIVWVIYTRAGQDYSIYLHLLPVEKTNDSKLLFWNCLKGKYETLLLKQTDAYHLYRVFGYTWHGTFNKQKINTNDNLNKHLTCFVLLEYNICYCISTMKLNKTGLHF